MTFENLKFEWLAYGDRGHCETVLRALPEWFGIESSIQSYIEAAPQMPMVVASLEGAVIGFCSVKKHSVDSAEIYVMGFLPEYHRLGGGRKLLERLESILKEDGVRFLQVKTLDESRADTFYDKTRQFYCAAGFSTLEVFPTLWDEKNPCLLMIKAL